MLCALIGLPGSGKSTVGRQLSRRLQLPFFDSDQVIERQLGCSIREYFEREGEVRFRDVEESVLDDLTQNQQGVLSTGGALFCDPPIVNICTVAARLSISIPHPTNCSDVCAMTLTDPSCRWLIPWAACVICTLRVTRCIARRPISSSRPGAPRSPHWST